MNDELPPWPHQPRAVSAIEDAIARGVRRVLFTAPTGSGKTRIMTDLIAAWLDAKQRIVLYTNRKLLVEQTVDVMKRAGIKHGVRASGWDDSRDRDVQISSIQTEHARVLRSKEWPLHDATRVLIDEAHIQKAAVARAIIDRHVDGGAVAVGMTATPIGLKDVYDELLSVTTMAELRACGALVAASHFGPDEPDTRHIKKQKSGEYSEKDNRKVIMTQTIWARVLDWYKKLNADQRPSILFAPDVAGSIWFAEEFSKAGIPAAHIDGSECWLNGSLYRSTRSIRRDILAMSKDGRIKVLCNRFVLREGVDCPWLEHGIFCTVFGALQSYLQSGGRLLRASKETGKKLATIQDHGGNWWRHGSLNENRAWELSFTSNIVEALREDSLQNKHKPEPIRCPKCGAVRLPTGPRCQHCGFEVHDPNKRSRPVIQLDGTIREHRGDIFKPKRVKLEPNTEQLWLDMYFRAKKSRNHMTFRQAEGLFFYEHHYYPPRELKFMPVSTFDWFEQVAKVPPERLRA